MAIVVLGLDLGTNTGFAIGEAGTVPRSGTVTLKKKSEGRAVLAGNFIAWLAGHFASALRPQIVAFESVMPLGAFGERGVSEEAVAVPFGMRMILQGMCHRYGIRHEEAAESTIRKHFIGVGRLGENVKEAVKRGERERDVRQRNRNAIKLAVLDRCAMLGYLPPRSGDDDRGDALAVWDWAAATFARRPAPLALFKESAR